MRQLLLFLCVCSCLTALRAQTPETGFVTGRVLAADTNGPARTASVVLVPVVDTSFLPKPNVKEADQPREAMTHVVQTGLDGRFAIPRVPPGNYYVVAEKHGYLQPLSLIKREQMNKPDSATADLMGRLLTPVTVIANHGAEVEARIYRGASLSGSVHYDDGSPAISTSMRVLRKDKTGKWQSFAGRPIDEYSAKLTDDEGSFRLTGLPAGEYLIDANLQLDELFVDHLFADGGASSSNTKYSLDVYYGDTYRKADGKIVKVSEGESATGLNITVRVSEMHALSGTVTEGNGQPVNAATVSLLWKDDGSQLVSTHVRNEDNDFHFDFVPDGEYTLRVSEARSVVRTEIPNCPRCVPPTHTDEKTVKSFGNAEQPLALHTDVQAVIVPVPAVNSGSKGASAP